MKTTAGRAKYPLHHAFTLIEVMVVVIILGILATLVAPRVLDRIDQARQMAAKSQIRMLSNSIQRFKMDTRQYPDSLQDLVSNPGLSGWQEGGYLEHSRVPKDPWGREYVYIHPGRDGRDFDLYSYGRDGQRGGSGYDAEIRSWELD